MRCTLLRRRSRLAGSLQDVNISSCKDQITQGVATEMCSTHSNPKHEGQSEQGVRNKRVSFAGTVQERHTPRPPAFFSIVAINPTF